MKSRWFFVLSALQGLALACAGGRWRRHLDQLGVMIGCRLGEGFARSWVDYFDYGCYCGLGGQGSPLDAVDGAAVSMTVVTGGVGRGGRCRWYQSPYWTHYTWSCRKHRPHCYDASDTCARSICTCDKELVNCFSRHTFHPHLMGIDKEVMCQS